MASVVILDWTADRLRAWAVAAHEPLRSIPLEATGTDLPLVVSLAQRRLQIGKTARALVRQAPHQVALAFFPFLSSERRWQFGRHDLDARELLLFVLTRLREKLPVKSIFHVVPTYWTSEQSALLEDLTRSAGFRLLGIMRRALVISGSSPGLAIDADAHAAVISITRSSEPGPKLRLQKTSVLPELALPYWKERIAALAASRCIRDCRRDPRASAKTDQELDEQIDAQLDDWAANQEGRLTLHGTDWEQEISLPAAAVQEVCSPLAFFLARQVSALADGAAWFLTAEASRLPGLAAALYAASQNQRSITILPVELLPRSLAGWALLIERGQLPAFHDQDATFPFVSEAKSEATPDTLPFSRRKR